MPIAVLSSFLFQFLRGKPSGSPVVFNWIISNFARQTKSREVNGLGRLRRLGLGLGINDIDLNNTNLALLQLTIRSYKLLFSRGRIFLFSFTHLRIKVR